MYSYFLNFFEHVDPFLWNILKFTKKLKWFGEHLIRENDFWYKQTTCPHAFVEWFKNIKRLLKHGEFSWKFCSYNFESIRTYF
jgi:DNA modification methylase